MSSETSLTNTSSYNHLRIRAAGSYSFDSKKVRYSLGIHRPFGSGQRFGLGYEYHDLTDSEDWFRRYGLEEVQGDTYNSENATDYFRRIGHQAYLFARLDGRTQAGVSFRSDGYTSLKERSLEDEPNPPVEEGRMRSIIGTVRFASRGDLFRIPRVERESFLFPSLYVSPGLKPERLRAEATYEVSRPGLGSDFDFSRLIGRVRFHRPMAPRHRLDAVAYGGFTEGAPPLPKRFFLGGLGTLRGFDRKQFTGKDMFDDVGGMVLASAVALRPGGDPVLRRRRDVGRRRPVDGLEARRGPRPPVAPGGPRFRPPRRRRPLEPRGRTDPRRALEPAPADPLLMLAAVFGLALVASAPLPDGNEYVRLLVDKEKRREEALNHYTYDVEQLSEELDAKGVVTSRKVRRYEIFYVKGKPLQKLVAEDGRPLSGGEREAEEEHVRDKVQSAMKERVSLDDPGVRLSAILERYDFRTLRREDLDGWPALVLEFRPRPGKRDLEGDVVLRSLGGRIWVDEEEKEVVRAEVNNTSPINIAFGVGASVSGLNVTLDFRKIEDGLWLPSRVVASAEARVLLVKGFRGRTTSIFSKYRRFGADSSEEVKAPTP